MKKAVIATGGKQYLVSEGEELDIEVIKGAGKKVEFDALLVVDGDKTTVGTPLVKGVKVSADVVDSEARGGKVTSIRYKAKKRVRTVHGHKQHLMAIKIAKIA